MAKASRVQRTVAQLVEALDQQQFLLRNSLHALRQDGAHLRSLATGLRTLVCLCSGTEGLLWRLVDASGVPDAVELECAGKLDRKHPIGSLVSISTIPLWRRGFGPPGLQPGWYRLHDVIKRHEAIYVAALQDVVFTHEMLIGAVAGQIGAHEAEGLDQRLIQLNGFLLNQQPLYVPALAFNAELTMQVGERVLDDAERRGIHTRIRRGRDHGSLTIMLRCSLKQPIAGIAPLMTFQSPISELELTVSAGPRSLIFSALKRGTRIAEVKAPYPEDWSLNEDAIFAFSYSSNLRQARVIVNRHAVGKPAACNLGWLDAREIVVTQRLDKEHDLVMMVFAAVFPDLIQPRNCHHLLRVPREECYRLQPRPQPEAFPE
jgi:hypothetical protein